MPTNLVQQQVEELRARLGPLRAKLTALADKLNPESTGNVGGDHRGDLPKKSQPARQVDADSVRAALDALQSELTAFRGTLDGTVTETTTNIPTRDESGSSSAPSADLHTSFGDFISSVGHSVAHAQSELDKQAREHLAASRGQGGPLLPTLYRIPKLSAEVKFAFGKETDKGLNLLFFSKKERSSEEHQQSVAFDIVAVPPPPELIERLGAAGPAIRLVLDSEARNKVFNAVRERASEDLPAADGKILAAVLGEDAESLTKDANRALILESVPNPRKEFVLVLAGSGLTEAESTDIGIWHVSLAGSKEVSAALKFKQADLGRVNQAPLRSLMAALGDQQAKVLAAAGGESKT